jgi:hypothetical protein
MQWTKAKSLVAMSVVATGAAALASGDRAAMARGTSSVTAYDHIVLIMEENEGYPQIIGNPEAATMNALANAYGLATAYYGVGDPSAPNYVATLGGNTFGIADDNPYYTHVVDKPSLMSQLEQAGLTWKGYYQSMPYPGYRGYTFPGRANGIPDFDGLYSSKHNGVPYFKSIQTSATERAKMVPLETLIADLASPPNFMYIIPDQCHDMHGAPPWCLDSSNFGDAEDNQLVSVADQFVKTWVDTIMDAPFWSKGNNAIVITFDEGDDTAGCCDANPGTGQVATIVITSHGPRGLKDPTPYNHYSLLQTMQKAFGLGCLEFTCDTTNVTPMAPLFKAQ